MKMILPIETDRLILRKYEDTDVEDWAYPDSVDR